MASISSLMGGTSSSGSIYGSRNANIISGLASGLDTETMIEGLVQSYQQKITGLEQDRTKLQWQQEAYQSISDKLVLCGRIIIFLVSVPVLKTLYDVIVSLIGLA